MDPKLPQVSNSPINPDIKCRNGQIGRVGNESGADFRHIVGRFIHKGRGNASQTLQSSIDWPLHDSVASLAVNLGRKSPQSVKKAENQHPSPLNGKKRAAEYSTLPRKLGTQEMYRKSLPRTTEISTNLIYDTIQYLQAVSDHIWSSDTVSSREWDTMHLATQLLQSRYEDLIAREDLEKKPLFRLYPAQTQPEGKCQQCATADEERLYN
ncbi:hypothetical protein PENANT_c119G01406 [Penicillium antarcticum]|uniref:Uncharacterized protein n=1 Tax=Penicillium antarcticum TaxID=416450 RepID=A0A1V6PI76_9EURO|nr:hypothetical protein PENANT_c119G01406 [Penicillium antarcticum]